MIMRKTAEDISIITNEIVEGVTALLKDDIYKIFLYGSYARGDYTQESDIDIMIVSNCSKERLFEYKRQINKLASRIGLKNDIEVSLLMRDRETFEQGNNVLPFYKVVQEEGIELYENITGKLLC